MTVMYLTKFYSFTAAADQFDTVVDVLLYIFDVKVNEVQSAQKIEKRKLKYLSTDAQVIQFISSVLYKSIHPTALNMV